VITTAKHRTPRGGKQSESDRPIAKRRQNYWSRSLFPTKSSVSRILTARSCTVLRVFQERTRLASYLASVIVGHA